MNELYEVCHVKTIVFGCNQGWEQGAKMTLFVGCCSGSPHRHCYCARTLPTGEFAAHPSCLFIYKNLGRRPQYYVVCYFLSIYFYTLFFLCGTVREKRVKVVLKNECVMLCTEIKRKVMFTKKKKM
jgi:hypothetical protein